MEQTAASWKTHLGLIAHPEGGYFKETYQSPDILKRASLPERYRADRYCATAIYFLLEGEQVSKFHRLQSDELWVYHAGSALTLSVIERDGTLQQFALGIDPDRGEQPQIAIPRGVWFGANINHTNSFTLVSCIVAPGFDFEDFELAKRAELTQQYPQHEGLIKMLT